ncbi:MAG: class I SAM-dependent methyltransferase [Alphaproteobacteria bacterium]|nr:class I SAM-dependent methyltransferase [Alphaproteobacteria bacterium]
MSGDTASDDINEAKANMDHIYDQPDPRAYFHELRKLGYAIPGAAKPIFQKLISRLRHQRNDTVHVLDLGCSYGVNAALLKHDLSMPDLYDHWSEEDIAGIVSEELIASDRRYFSNLDEQADITVTGLDQADSAISFAEESGLLDEGLAINLETAPLPGEATENLAQVDLVTSTGCVGYLTEKSFERLLPALTKGRSPWIGNFVLRMFPFDAIEDTLTEWGYITEKLEGQTFVQRDFVSDEEQEQVLEQLHKRGIDPAGKESEGQLLAEFYLSRPANEVEATPIEHLLAA